MKTMTAAEADLPARFWAKVDLLGACWEWQGYRGPNGYGRFSVGGRGGRMEGAHRVAYTLVVGPIPEERHLDHLCRNRGCVNPAHLEAVTPAENARRGIAGEVNAVRQRAITQCPAGHPYDVENTLVRPNGSRKCRACARLRKATPEGREKARRNQAALRARKRGTS